MSNSRLYAIFDTLELLANSILLFGSILCSSTLSAQEIEFATKDGKHTTRGTIASFVNVNGNATKLPRSLTADTQVVIKRQDGTTTPPIQLSKLSDKTRTAITNFVVRTRKGERGTKHATDKPSDFFLKHQQRLIGLATEHAELGPIDQVDPVEKEQYLSELRAYKKELGPDATSDWAVRFTLSYLEGEYGANKYGELYLLAKNSRDFWIAWQSAVIFALRYRENISDSITVMDLYLAELSDYQKREAENPNPQALEKAGHAALWLRETVKLVQSSGLANEPEVKRLKQIQISTAVKRLIKSSKIPDAVLEEAENRRRVIEKERRDAETEAQRIKQMALDKRIRECGDLLDRFMKSYDKQWESGIETFDRQQVLTNEASQNLQETEKRVRDYRRSNVEWTIIASRDLGEEPTGREIRYQQEAQSRAKFYLRELNRALFEARQRLIVFNTERQRLAQTHAMLADFVNRGKNQMILFENYHLDTIKADPTLKQVYIEFTDKVKAVVAQFPPMPTIVVPRKNDTKLEAQSLSQEQRDKTNGLSFSFTVDLKDFLHRLSTP